MVCCGGYVWVSRRDDQRRDCSSGFGFELRDAMDTIGKTGLIRES